MNIMSEYYLAVDIGASSGRHILGHMDGSKLICQEVYRFPNGGVMKNGTLCWDSEGLFHHIIQGLKRCGELGMIPCSMAIDTWGVDFALLDENGQLIGDTVAYRDSRTEGTPQQVAQVIPEDELYRRTGTQKQSFNTIYQLYTLKDQLSKASSMLMMPDYLGYRLTGQARQEYTNASTSGLVDCRTRKWDMELVHRLGYPTKLFKELDMPGTKLGTLLPGIQQQVGFDCDVIMCAGHDTASAVLTAGGRDSIYLSSGTWSLMGTELEDPVTTNEARALNYTNEGGSDGHIRFLKNITGLWVIQSLRSEYGITDFTLPPKMARENRDFPSIIDINDPSLLAPPNMEQALKELCRLTGQPVPETQGQVMAVAYASLAACYGATARELTSLTGKSFKTFRIVGGGSKDQYLNQLAQEYTGMEVSAGPAEATAAGNLLCQLMARGVLDSLDAARAVQVIDG